MENSSIMRACGVFSLTSITLLIFTIGDAVAIGAKGPQAMDWFDPAVLAMLRDGGSSTIFLTQLALAGPVIALGGGLGWYFLLRNVNRLVGLGVLLWYVGMALIIWQDAIELVMVVNLPDAYFAASGSDQATLLAAGGVLGLTIEVIQKTGDIIAAIGVAMVSVVLFQAGGKWRWLAGLGFASVFASLAGFLLPVPPQAGLLGFLLFVPWNAVLTWRMLRAKPVGAA